MRRAVENSSQRGDVVYDPFGGRGTTMIACERTQRQARVVEIDPKYCDVILRRFTAETGIEPELIERLEHQEATSQ